MPWQSFLRILQNHLSSPKLLARATSAQGNRSWRANPLRQLSAQSAAGLRGSGRRVRTTRCRSRSCPTLRRIRGVPTPQKRIKCCSGRSHGTGGDGTAESGRMDRPPVKSAGVTPSSHLQTGRLLEAPQCCGGRTGALAKEQRLKVNFGSAAGDAGSSSTKSTRRRVQSPEEPAMTLFELAGKEVTRRLSPPRMTAECRPPHGPKHGTDISKPKTSAFQARHSVAKLSSQ